MILSRSVCKYTAFIKCSIRINLMSKRSVGQRGGLIPTKKSKLNAKQTGDQKLGYIGASSQEKLSNLDMDVSKSGDTSMLIKDAKENVTRLHKMVKEKKETKPKVAATTTVSKLRPRPAHKRPIKLAKAEEIGQSTSSAQPGATCAEKYGFEYLATPLKPASDKKEYKVIQLTNGLRAILISDVLCPKCSMESSEDESESESDGECETEGDSESVASSPAGRSSGGEESGGESRGEESGTESWTDADTSEGDTDVEASGEEEGEGEEDSRPLGKQRSETKMAAVGLTVGVGSFSDPENIPGLAHFLEHMVFMGSDKFPKENHFDSFIQSQGGSDNAHTDCETTTFYFECQEKNLQRGMDKFAQFFTAPLMKKEAMTREREAVESEFQESLSSDDDRCIQLLASLARSGHPATKFTWGNAASLRDGVTAARLHSALHAFRQRHYSAHRMTLAVQARLPMTKLEEFVASTFSSVPTNALPADDFSAFRGSFDTSAFRRLYRVSSVKDDLRLNLTWALPPCIHLYRCKPYAYLEHLLDHEGDGSLSQHLRDKLLALHVCVSHSSSGFENNSMYFLFTLEIKVTQKGYDNINDVVTAVFAYLAMLRLSGPSQPLFAEMQAMSEANFHYADESEASDYVEELSENLQYFPPEDCIAAQHLLYDYMPELIEEFLAALTPDTVNVIVESQDPSVAYDQEEKWFKTKYNVSDVPPAWLTAWRYAAPLPSYHLPARNVYLPTDFAILPAAADEVAERHPINVDADQMGEVWYKRDVKFGQPVAYYCCYLVSPELQLSPTNSVLLDIYASMLEFQLARELYPAKAAAISCAVVACHNGLTIRVGGFNQKILIVWEAICKKMATFKDNFDQKEFDAIVSNKRMTYYNTFLKPSKLNTDLRLKLLVNNHWTAAEKHAALMDGVDGEMLAAFVSRYNARLYAQCLVQGNVTREQALAARHAVFRHLDSAPVPQEVYPQYRVRRVELGERVVRVRSFNSGDPNSVITNYYQSGPGTVRDSCLVELAMALMEEPLFDTLRTKEQLGYSVRCEMRDTHGVLGYTISVHHQEDKRDSGGVDSRVEAFLRSFHARMKRATADRLERARRTLLKLKRCADVHLREEVGRNWSEVLANEYLFDRNEKEIAALEGIALGDVRKWVDEHLACGSANKFRKLSIQVAGNANPGGAEPEGKTVLPSPQSDGVESPDAEEGVPNKKFPLQLVAESGASFVQDIDAYQQELFVYPFHQILE